MNRTEILVIDDEAQIRKLLEITLNTHDYQVRVAATAKEGMYIAATYSPDLILLDLGLPDENGHSVLKKLREWYTKPILILSVQSGEEEIINALDAGANDYLIKPFRSGELLARIRSALRGIQEESQKQVIVQDALEIDFTARIVKKKNEIVKLTSTEYNLLSLFMRNEGRVLTHHYLLKEVWGPGYINQSQYLRVFIAQLRKKIEDEPNQPEYIVTESRVGYRFVTKEELI